MRRRSLILVVSGLVLSGALSACSGPPGAIDAPYSFSPATVFGPPLSSNVFFTATSLSTTNAPFALGTDPANAHTAFGCSGTTVFEGSHMTVDWACSNATRMWTVQGKLTWDGKEYFGDCTTSLTSATLNWSNLIVPFRAYR